ncbi:MAG: CerR family C-terminal domain-containing protein, partial [Planctomycetota bacterium]
RELLGPEVPARLVHFCVASTVSQCVDVIGHIRQADIHEEKEIPQPLDEHISENIEKYADHVAEFSLAGLRATRARFSGDEEAAGEVRART